MHSSVILTETSTYFVVHCSSPKTEEFYVWLFLGAYFLRDCPVQPYIPVYLIVFGVFVLLVPIVSLGLFYGLFAKDTLEMLLLSLLVISVSFILYLFVVCWFITGECLWICQMGITEGRVKIFYRKNNGEIF